MTNKLLIFSALAILWIEHANATTKVGECIPVNWDGYWNSTIRQCYFDKVNSQKETIKHFLSEQDVEDLRLNTKQNCAIKTSEYGGEMAKLLYWDCFSASLQSEIDKGMAKASNNVKAFKSVDWTTVNHCKATYFSEAVETKIGSNLKGEKGWTSADFPKEVMNTRCEIVADYDGLIIYEGSKEWESGNHFFYVSVFDDFPISIHSQPEVTSTHAQWTVTEFAELHTETDETGCFTSKEIEICFTKQK